MDTFDVVFYPGQSDPTGQALENFGEKDETLREIMETEIWELANANSLSATYVIHVGGQLWCLHGRHKDLWGFMFFAKMDSNEVTMLNGYTRRLRKLPKLSAGQIRKARYLLEGLAHA